MIQKAGGQHTNIQQKQCGASCNHKFNFLPYKHPFYIICKVHGKRFGKESLAK